ncbi:hypothetical protein ABW19_dt0205914 [Dactylella cylindrospora]|nr:hypothetical protein ABW19_dt0205914 [Dactylella cylindrospora]
MEKAILRGGCDGNLDSAEWTVNMGIFSTCSNDSAKLFFAIDVATEPIIMKFLLEKYTKRLIYQPGNRGELGQVTPYGYAKERGKTAILAEFHRAGIFN